jgi:outer membrane protein assembly factor BamB
MFFEEIVMRRKLFIGLVTLGCVFSLSAGDWTGFRGPEGDGVSPDTGFPTTWSAEENVKWRIPLTDPGNGSPVIVGDRIYLVTGADQGHRRSLVCLDRKNGAQIWEQTVEYTEDEETHQTNPHGSATTPAVDVENNAIVVWHGSAGLHCYSLEGEHRWSRELGQIRHIWGYGTSPVIHEGRVILLGGPGVRQFLGAYDLASGDTVWEFEEPGGSYGEDRYIGSWCTPVIASVNGSDQIICVFPTRVVGVDPASGEIIWTCNGVSSEQGDLCYTSPLVHGNICVVMGGYMGPAFAVRIDGKGDVTATHRLWHTGEESNPQRIGTGVIIDGKLFMANADDAGSLQCIDIETGEVNWEVGRTGDGAHWGSTILADGRLYATGLQGVIHVFEPNADEYVRIAENNMGETIHATPAFSDGEIFVRGWSHLYCISDD